MNLRSTSLIDAHKKAGAKLVPFAGFEMPIQYEGIVKEHHAVRHAAGLFDASHMGELRVRGPDALKAVNRLIANDLKSVIDGQAIYTCCCNEQGGILDDLIVYRISTEEIYIVCNASNREKIVQHFAFQLQANKALSLVDESDNTALLALQGPLALAILASVSEQLSAVSDEVPSFFFKNYRLAQHEIMIARTGYTGEDGVEIFCDWDAAPEIFKMLMTAGQDFGLKPAGLGCRDTLRLEARLSLYGNELSEELNPLEAGLSWTVKLHADDFIGRQALLDAKEKGLAKKLVAFEMLGRGIARSHYPLLSENGESIGICASGSPSPTLGKAIGLGYLPMQYQKVGTQFKVDCRGKQIDAIVVKAPFYRRKLAK